MSETAKPSWRDIEPILEQAFELEGAAREAFLREACPDAELRSYVDALLNADAREGLLDVPIDQVAEPLLQATGESGALAPGTRVGVYRVVREIGRGGMGRVYRAERADGQFEQTVALKLIRKGLAWGELRERFLQERQILAGLNHPNIARLLDGGLTEDGRPYFALEYVEGVPITDYARDRKLALYARLALFEQVCRTVAYAQQHLVVHRDLKPSNILITDAGEVRLLDFGIARLLGTSEDSRITQFGPRVLTPEYAAPEQTDGGTVTTATDVFALGRVLSELLGGKPAAGSGAPELARLPRDLQIITAKASAIEPQDRYAAAADLAADLRRYLDGLPIVGRRPSAAYRLQRFVARNALGVAAGVALVLSLGAGLVLTTWQAERAEREANRAREVTEFLVNLFEEADPDLQQGIATTAAEILARGSARIETELASEPGLQAELLDVVGRIHLKRGEYAMAAQHFEQALALREPTSDPLDPVLATSLAGIGEAYLWQSEYERSELAFERALAIERARHPQEPVQLAKAASNLATVRQRQGELETVEALYREALELDRQALGDNAVAVANDLSNLAVFVDTEGRHDEAEALHLEALAILRDNLPAVHTALGLQLHNVGHHYLDVKNLEEAERYLREAVEVRRTVYQGRHPRLASSLRVLGMILREQDRTDEAQALFEQSLEVLRSYFGDVHSDVASALNDLAIAAYLEGDLVTARERFAEALAIFEQLLPAGHTTVLTLQSNLGRIALDLGDLEAAESTYRNVLEQRLAQFGDTHPGVAESWHAMATVYVRQERWDEALTAIETTLAIHLLSLPEQNVTVAVAQTLQGRILAELARLEDALAVLQVAQRTLEAELPAGHRRIYNLQLEQGLTLIRAGRAAEALPLLEGVVEHRRATYGDADGRTGDAVAALGLCLLDLGREADAQPLLEEAVATLRETRGPQDFETRRAERALTGVAPL